MLTRSGLALIALAVLVAASAPAQLVIVDTEPGIFIDISESGIGLGISGDEEAPISTPISNAVFPGGEVWVGNNGALGFGELPDTNLPALNEPIFNNAAFGGGQALCGFWDDIDDTYGDIYYENREDVLIVQWDGKEFADSTDTVTFQLQIFDGVRGGNPIYAQMIYVDVQQPRADGGGSATIGYQDGGAGFNSVEWSYNTSGAVSNGTVLSLIPEPASLLLVIIGGLAAGRRR
jgi:hypothetical protein